MPSGVRVTQDHMRDLEAGLKRLTGKRLLVGIPADRAGREPGDGHAADPSINNAELGYIHENGAPEVNIPPRPFLVPGVAAAHKKIEDRMKRAGEAALDGRPRDVDRQFASCGMEVVSVIQERVEDGLSPPLSSNTLRDRDAAMKSDLRGKNAQHIVDFNLSERKPLIDTGSLLRSITWVVREGRETTAEGEKS